MPLPAFRNPRSKVRRRRSHDALKKKTLSTCAKCQAPILPHHACKVCGAYGNRTVEQGKSAAKVIEKKTAKKKLATAQE